MKNRTVRCMLIYAFLLGYALFSGTVSDCVKNITYWVLKTESDTVNAAAKGLNDDYIQNTAAAMKSREEELLEKTADRELNAEDAPEKTTAEKKPEEYLVEYIQKTAGMQNYMNSLSMLSEEEWNQIIQEDSVKTISHITAIKMDAADYECLLKIVQSEAGICDEKGKILIANVIMNRIQSPYFPDTVTEVVYQTNQFSPVLDGTIDTAVVTEDTITAVEKALSGVDYSQGALFFAARELAEQNNMEWFDENLLFLFEHDGHEFFKIK